MIQVTLDRVAILFQGDPDKIGHIIVPDQAKGRSKQGLVMQVGPGRRDADGDLIPMTVRVGNYVLFPAYSGTVVGIDDANWIIMPEDQITAIIPLKSLVISGLYHKDAEMNAIPATLDSAIECIRRALHEEERVIT